MTSRVLGAVEAVRLAERLGASEAEATLVETRSVRIEVHGGRLSRATTARRLTVGVRAARGKRVGGAGGEASRGLERIIEKALSIAGASREDPRWPGFNPRVACSGAPRTVDPAATSAGPEELAGLLAGQAGLAESLGGRVVEAVLVVSYGRWEYANSYGGPVRGEGTSVAYWLESRVDYEGGYATHGEAYMGVRLDRSRMEEATRKSVERAWDVLRARSLPGPLRGGVVLSGEELAGLVETLIVPAISAASIQKGRSPLAGRIGERVLSERLTIVDDPFLDYETGSTCADDEGHPTSRKSVFESGVFRTPLYDHYHASLEGRESTGNGFRGTPWQSPSPSPTNLVIEYRGETADSMESLASTIGRGLIVVSTIGSWLSNPANGMINATVALGYLVENGEVQHSVKGAVFSGNIYEILGESLLGASRDRRCYNGVCAPSVAAGGASFA